MKEFEKALIDRAVDSDRPLRVVCIGAGYSGILTAIRFPQRIKNLDLVIYEKNDDIGGTWYENRYPGVACDIPSHVYQFTFASNPSWSSFYAPGAEIQQYLKDVAWKYDVEKYVRLRHHFNRATWLEDRRRWRLSITKLETGEEIIDHADILLRGTGLLNRWRWPEIEGIHDFKGPYMHTANWDGAFDWEDRVVALIGAGSSGIQVLPKIQPKSKRVLHFMKGKNWISPVGYGAEEAGPDESTSATSPHQPEAFKNDPSLYHQYRHQVEGSMNKSQHVTFRGTDIQKLFWEMSDTHMKEKLKTKPEIYHSLRPDYPPGCRRLTPGPGYLEALVEDNVDFIGSGISKVTEKGVIDTQGQYHEVDAIIYATGFDYSFDTGDTPYIGRDGVTLNDVWSPYPHAYLSLCSPKMPNLFFFLGPNGGPGAGSFIAMLENVVEYIIKCALKMQREHIGSMEISEKANLAFSKHVDKYFEKTIFTFKCKSWFKRNQDDGRIVGLWPGSSVHAQEALKSPRFEDYLYTYLPECEDNNMTWLGNGLTIAQENDWKTTAYLDEVDIPPVINKGPRPVENNDKSTLCILKVAVTNSSGEIGNNVSVVNDLREAAATIPV